MVRALLETDIDVDHVNNLGWTALLEAVILGEGGPPHQQIVRALVDAGADVDLADRDGVTPLAARAAARGYAEIVRTLEAAGRELIANTPRAAARGRGRRPWRRAGERPRRGATRRGRRRRCACPSCPVERVGEAVGARDEHLVAARLEEAERRLDLRAHAAGAGTAPSAR